MQICPLCLRRFDDSFERCPEDGTGLREYHGTRPDSLVGRVIEDRWIIEERVGEGGMGAVYRARQLNIDRQVAIKTLRTALTEREEYVGRFFREANIASTISHPHFVAIHDFGQTREEHALYLVMEYLDGSALSSYMFDEGLSLRQILLAGSQIAAALSAAHAENIVHRDLKPENIFVIDVAGSEFYVKVLDFGIAKVLDDSQKPMTRTGQIFGTPEFMSPEQCRGLQIDHRADLYSLGCILYNVIAGYPPFRSHTPVVTLMMHVNDEPPPLMEQGRGLPPQVGEVVMRLLAKEPDERFGSAEEVRKALQDLLDELPNERLDVRCYPWHMPALQGQGELEDDSSLAHTRTYNPDAAGGESSQGAAQVQAPGARAEGSLDDQGMAHRGRRISQVLTIPRLGEAPTETHGIVTADASGAAIVGTAEIARPRHDLASTPRLGEATLRSSPASIPTDVVEQQGVGARGSQGAATARGEVTGEQPGEAAFGGADGDKAEDGHGLESASGLSKSAEQLGKDDSGLFDGDTLDAGEDRAIKAIEVPDVEEEQAGVEGSLGGDLGGLGSGGSEERRRPEGVVQVGASSREDEHAQINTEEMPRPEEDARRPSPWLGLAIGLVVGATVVGGGLTIQSMREDARESQEGSTLPRSPRERNARGGAGDPDSMRSDGATSLAAGTGRAADRGTGGAGANPAIEEQVRALAIAQAELHARASVRKARRLGEQWRPRVVKKTRARSGRRRKAVSSAMRSKKSLQRDLKRLQRSAEKSCYAKQLGTRPDLPEGQITVKFLILADGRVDKETVVSRTIKDAPLEECVLKLVAARSFGTSLTNKIHQIQTTFRFAKSF